jgi:hypothetical protein
LVDGTVTSGGAPLGFSALLRGPDSLGGIWQAHGTFFFLWKTFVFLDAKTFRFPSLQVTVLCPAQIIHIRAE